MDAYFDDDLPDDLDALFARPDSPAPAQPNPDPPAPADPLLAALNPPQRAAVIHTGTPLLVVAGAGSGKTRVLTRRIAYLIAERGVHPGSILAITFTNKAAKEMRERVTELVGNRSRFMWVSTFHSACVRMLRANAAQLGLSSTFSIYDDTDSRRLVSAIIREMNLDSKKFPVRTVRGWISAQKNALVTPEKAMVIADKFPVNIYAEVYAEYAKRLAASQALDFDDLLVVTVRLLTEFPDVRDAYRARFRHVLVDEFQDTNDAQYAIIHALCAPEPGAAEEAELMVVGDSDQSIYAFRGASIENILNFATDFPGARTIALEQNYRSTQTILSAANSLISHNLGRPEKNLWTDSGEGAPVTGYVADSEHDEARFIADELRALSAAGQSRYGDAAVFYRTNAQSRAIEEIFIRLGLPYRVVGGVRFYERKEVRDALAYLRAIANPADEVSVERILNVPTRGIGEKTEEALRSYSRSAGCTLTEAIERADQIAGLGPQAVKRLAEFAELMARHRAMVQEGAHADVILRSILDESRYLPPLRNSADPQDQTRAENLAELVAVAAEFVRDSLDASPLDELLHDDDPLSGDDEDWLGGSDSDAGPALLGAPEPDPSLSAFLERIALVADADEIPDAEGGENQGSVTLMTLHTAKGLEFDTVFVTGLEEGLFPHDKARTDPAQLEEERRLAYVGLTRARKRLYVTRAVSRTQWGQPAENPPSRFLGEVPRELVEWRRADRWLGGGRRFASRDGEESRLTESGRSPAFRSAGAGSGSVRPTTARSVRVLTLSVGDRVKHDTFGMGVVKSVSGEGEKTRAEIKFAGVGVKLFLLAHAPMQKV